MDTDSCGHGQARLKMRSNPENRPSSAADEAQSDGITKRNLVRWHFFGRWRWSISDIRPHPQRPRKWMGLRGDMVRIDEIRIARAQRPWDIPKLEQSQWLYVRHPAKPQTKPENFRLLLQIYIDILQRQPKRVSIVVAIPFTSIHNISRPGWLAGLRFLA